MPPAPAAQTILRSTRAPFACCLLLLLFAALALPALGADKPRRMDPEELTRHVLAGYSGDLPGMVKRKRIRILVAYNRISYFLDGAMPRGVDYETGKMFEQYVNRRLGLRGAERVLVVFVPVARDELLPSLQEGRGDIAAANLTVTDERLKEVDFGAPFDADVDEVVVTGPSSPELENLGDLSGKALYVRRSSSYYEHLEELNRRFEAEGRPPMILKAADENLEDEDLLEMVNAGLLPLAVVERSKADFWAKVYDEITVRGDLAVHTGGRSAWAIRKNSPQLRTMVDNFVAQYRSSDEEATILARYREDTHFVTNALSTEDRKRFDAARDAFEQAGRRYGFDPLLLMAQAYQESRLDQEARGPKGGVGVMQILPSTAKSDPVGVKGIDTLEKNIEAGAKYERHLIDTYFSDPGIDELNRTLFAFAAYNAGPTAVNNYRKVAERMGLDPDKWFGNVERAASGSAGWPLVRYVANIYMYYVAYTLMEEREEERAMSREKNMQSVQ